MYAEQVFGRRKRNPGLKRLVLILICFRRSDFRIAFLAILRRLRGAQASTEPNLCLLHA